MVLGVLPHPHVVPETHHTKNTCTDKATDLSLLDVQLVITSSNHINTCRAYSGWTSIVYCLRTIVIVGCLCIYKCTVVPVAPDFRVACILSSLLNCQMLNLCFRQKNLCYSISANSEPNVMDIRKYFGKRTQKEQSDKSRVAECDT